MNSVVRCARRIAANIAKLPRLSKKFELAEFLVEDDD